MKKFALLLALAPMSAFAVTTYDSARVESVEPLVETVRIPGHCRTVTVTDTVQGPASSGIGGGILGGIAGGLLGSKVGGGHGREVATAAGAITGALVGSSIDRNTPQQTSSTSQVCDPDRVSTRTVGYRVTYEYRGGRDVVTMPDAPGATIQMRVTAEPVSIVIN